MNQDLRALKPDVITNVSPNEGQPWHPVLVVLQRQDANKLSVGINVILRAVAEAQTALAASEDEIALEQFKRLRGIIRGLADLGTEVRKTLAEVGLALDIRLVGIPNQTGAADLRAQSRMKEYAGLYDDLARDLNPASRAFGEEPGSIYARCGHRKYAEVEGRIRCAEMTCKNYVRKALQGEQDGAAQPAE